MATNKKPQIGFGPIKDDLAKIIAKALSGAVGVGKKSQARRIVTKLEQRNPVLRSAGNNAVQSVKTKASKLERQLVKSKIARGDRAKTTQMAKEHMNKQTLKGLNWDGSPNKATQAYKVGQRKAEAEAAAKATKDKIVRSADRQMSKAEVEAMKGTGRYVSPSSGKVTNIPAKRAAAGRSKAGAIPAQMGNRNANLRKIQAGMRSDVKAAKTPAARLQATRVLRNHQNKYGTFGN